MKQVIFFIALLSQSYIFSMLTVINNHTQQIKVTYEPQIPGVDYSHMITPTSECKCQIHRPIKPGEKSIWSILLLKPFITITIPGFMQLINMSVLSMDTPIVVNAEQNNEIYITQATTILKVMKRATE